MRKALPQRFFVLLRIVALTGLLLSTILGPSTLPAVQAANPDGNLKIEVITAYNFIVDSNVTTPATHAPKSATIGAKVCNTGGTDMTGVTAYVGDFKGTVASSTPGTYLVRDSDTDAAFKSTSPHLADSGDYSLTHEGGSAGKADAIRYIGSLAAGTCRVEYWLVSYPRLKNGDPTQSVTGGIKPGDDLWLEYDIWVAATEGATARLADVTRRATMRNEISASANKIWPQTTSKVPNEYLTAIQTAFGWNTIVPGGGSTAYPGDTLVTRGIWYDFGNVGAGFDNDGNFIPDRNAWVQPVGDPDAYDPGCFRLVRTYGIIVVKLGGGGEFLIPFENQLYFSELPADNTGAVGLVYYEYVALDGACRGVMSPYQEVASGFDNEKFNADFGAGIPPLQTTEAVMTFDKNGDATVDAGNTVTYSMTYNNVDPDAGGPLTVTVGDPDVGLAFGVYDKVPTGTCYVAGSATAVAPADVNNLLVDGIQNAAAYQVFYSIDSDPSDGITWQTTEPGDADANSCNDTTYLKWTRVGAVANGSTGRVNFKVTVPSTYVTTQKTAIIENTGCVKLGDGNCFKEDTTITIVSGSLKLSGTVYEDTGTGGGVLANGVKDGSEPGIYGTDGVTVTLYYWNDKNSNNVVDAGELTQIKTTQTNASGFYEFTLLPAGKYITKVSTGDSDIPTGYGITTPDQRAATLVAADITGLDFGFAPPLKIAKRRDSPASVRVGDIVNYTISLTNVLPGGGDSSTACKYNLWATSEGSLSSGITDGKRFHNDFAGANPTNAFNAAGPDNLYAFTDYAASGSQLLDGAGIATGDMGGTIQSVKTRVKYYLDTPLLDDTGSVTLYVGAGAGTVNDTLTLTKDQLNAHVGAANAGWLEGAAKTTKLVGVVSSAWTWADLAPGAANPVHVVYENAKATAGDRVFLYIDAMAIQVTTDQVCGGADTILNPVPLTDTFVTNDLAFVSANPPISSSAPSGGNTILTWDNVGPLYPGQTKNITVSFTASQVIAGSTDTATSTNTKFATGVSANSPVSATASVAITAASTRSLSGTIFDDNNAANGWSGSAWTQAGTMTGMDAGDTGIANVPVDLYACVNQTTGALITAQNKTCYAAGGTWVLVRSTTTNASGVYTFSNLTLGVYYAKVRTASIPGSQVADVNLAGACGASCDSLSNNPIADNLNAFVGNLDDNTSVTRVNFGYDVGNGTSSTIGDTLYYDWNGNGTQDVATEETLKDVTVRLYNAAGGLVATDTDADHNGTYLFTGLASGVYTVKVDTTDTDFPSGLVVETQDPDESGVCVTCDSSANSTVNGTNSDLTRDFGYKPTGNTGQIGDTVWKDVDGDGTQLGSDETGISGVKVLLQVDLNGDGTYVTLKSTTTDTTGKYLFDQLPVGTQFNYRVVIDMSDSINTTAIPKDGLGNNYTPTTGTTSASLIYRNVTLTTAAPVDLTTDFGFTALAAIGNTIYWDVNANGQQDWSEKGIPGVTVKLYLDLNDNGLADDAEITDKCATGANPCVTDANGKYLFSKLPASTHKYLVVVDTTSTPLVGKTLTADPDNDGAACSGVAGVCDNKTAQRLYAGTLFTGANFGYQPTNVIGDTVWADTNQNGIQDLDANGNPTEMGLAGVTLRLYNDVNGSTLYEAGTDTLVTSTTTDISGQYLFSGLADGKYVVVVDPASLPSGYVQSADPTVPGVPCRGLPTCDNEGAATLAGNSVLTLDFGYVLYGDYSISGTICKDNLAEDGMCTGVAGEQALSGRPVNLYRLNGGVTEFVRTISTDGSGNYLFPNLPNGNYFVSTDTVQLFDKPRMTTGAPAIAVTDANSNLLGGYRPATINNANVVDQDFAFVSDAILDFGDLPDSYNTLLAANPEGPRHIVPGVPNLYLGATPPDSEADGQATATAKGDDGNGAAGNTEENGIVLNMDASFKWILTCDATNCHGNINVTSTVPASGGWLVGWMDFNEDGDFSDSGEMIVNQAVSTSSTQTLSVTAPLGAPSLVNYIYRFRLFPSEPMLPELSFTGIASNGEVEDYIWKAGTTAVSLMKFTANSSLPTVALPLVVVALLALGLTLLGRKAF